MSGVLERMAKRARGALPSVEPRSVPRFAPPASGIDGAGNAAPGIEEIFSEAESLANRRENAPRKRQSPQLHPKETPYEIGETGDATPQREPIRSAQANQTIRGTNADPLREARPNQPSPEGKPEPESKQAGVVDLKSSDSERGSEETGIEESREFTVRASMTREPEETTLEASQFVSRNASNREDNRATGDEAETPAARRSNRAQERESLAIEARSAARREADLLTPSRDGLADRRTEIHISIGNIELRAPRAEARPQAAPFRPRVTLDDYLRRKPEAGA